MKKVSLIALAAIVSGMSACIDNARDTKKCANVGEVAQTQVTRSFVVANNFSDRDWKNGVLRKDGKANVFYILQKEQEPIKLRVGDSVILAKTGRATIQNVTRSAANQESRFSVFVTLDRDIDPDGDGFPNKIYLQQ